MRSDSDLVPDLIASVTSSVDLTRKFIVGHDKFGCIVLMQMVYFEMLSSFYLFTFTIMKKK